MSKKKAVKRVEDSAEVLPTESELLTQAVPATKTLADVLAEKRRLTPWVIPSLGLEVKLRNFDLTDYLISGDKVSSTAMGTIQEYLKMQSQIKDANEGDNEEAKRELMLKNLKKMPEFKVMMQGIARAVIAEPEIVEFDHPDNKDALPLEFLKVTDLTVLFQLVNGGAAVARFQG